MRSRRGVALLTVVLFSALVLVVIIAVSSGVMTESTVTSTDLGFKRALAVAETGIAQTLGDLESAKWVSNVGTVDAGAEYLTTSQVRDIAMVAVNGTVLFDVKDFPDAGSRFQVKVRKISGAVWDGSSAFQNKSMVIGIYSLGEAFVSKTGVASGLLGRRVAYETATVAFDLSSAGDLPDAFDYGLFSGGEITFKGSNNSTVSKGSIYATDTIDLKGKDRLDNDVDINGVPLYVAISGNGAVVNAVAGDKTWDSGDNPAPVPIQFPKINLGFWYDRANDFKTGSNFYTGFSGPYPVAVIESYLGAEDASPTLNQVQSFCSDLKNGTGLWAAQLNRLAFLTFLESHSPAFYVVGGGTIAGNYSAFGSIVISGPGDPHDVDNPPATTSVMLASKTTISNLGGLAFFVHGDFSGAGQATINGLVYCDGSFINGSGQLTVNGSIVAMNMSKLSGQFNVTFDPALDIPTGGFPGSSISGEVSVSNEADTWVEKDLGDFNNAS